MSICVGGTIMVATMAHAATLPTTESAAAPPAAVLPPTEASTAVGGATADADATAAEPPPNFAANAAKPPPVRITGRRISARRPGVSSSDSSPTIDVQCAQPFTWCSTRSRSRRESP